MAATTPCPQGSQEPIFNIQKCQVPCIFPIPQGGWLEDPRVPQSPQDINDTATVDFIFPTPEIPCPELTSASSYLTVKKTDCCSFEFDIDLDITCPQITAVQGATAIVPVGSEYAEITVSKPQSFDSESESGVEGGCEFEFSLDIGFPCPQLITAQAQTSIVPVGQESAELTINSAQGAQDGCEFEFELNIDFPCPQITTAQAQTSVVPVGEEGATFSVVSAQAQDGCEFEFELAIDFPCPQMIVAQAQTAVVPIGDERAEVTVQKAQDGCEFELGLIVDFPCPQIEGAQAQTTIVPVGQESAEITISSSAQGCEFDISLDIDFPCPTIQSQVVVQWDRVPVDSFPPGPIGRGGGLTFGIQETSSCEFEFDIAVDFPCPQIESAQSQTSIVPVGDEKAEVTVTKLDPCEFEIEIAVDFPCPEISGTQGTSNIVPVGQEAAEIRVTKSQACEFEIEVSVDFP